jgi:hypothetical protein
VPDGVAAFGSLAEAADAILAGAGAVRTR